MKIKQIINFFLNDLFFINKTHLDRTTAMHASISVQLIIFHINELVLLLEYSYLKFCINIYR
jgi:hypothetical protein